MGKNFGVEVGTPLGNQSPPKHVVWRKNGGDTVKNMLSRGAQEVRKNIKKGKKTFEHDISPTFRGGPAGPIFTIFGVLGHTADVITHVKFQVDRSKGLGSTSTQSRVFPIDFDRRHYDSVTHYRATLWLLVFTITMVKTIVFVIIMISCFVITLSRLMMCWLYNDEIENLRVKNRIVLVFHPTSPT